MFCCSETLAVKLKRASGKSVTHALKKLLALDKSIFEKAADRVRALGAEAVVTRALIKRRKQTECPGFGDEDCIFSTKHARLPACLHPTRNGGELSCAFCSEEVLRKRLTTSHRGITGELKQLRSHGADVYDKAVQRVRLLADAACAQKAEAAIQRSVPKKNTAEHWNALLAQRTATRGPLRASEAEAYEKKRLRQSMGATQVLH